MPESQSHGDAADSSEDILDDLLESADREGSLDLAEVKARHPGHDTTIERLARAVSKYHSLSGELAPRASARRAPAPGAQIGDFTVEGELGRGGMGVVYRARQRSLGDRPVALKVLSSEGVDERARARFQREALAAAAVHHANLAEVYGFGTGEGLLYYAMQLVEGTSLRDVLEDLAAERRKSGSVAGASEPDRREIVRWTRDVAGALAALHHAGLVHRDVKPSNIMLERKPGAAGPPADVRAILVDFGLVRRVDSRTLTGDGSSGATPAYAAPEQLIGLDVDARADVFGLGVTLHDLLARRGPTERLQAAAGLAPIRRLAPAVDADLAAIVDKCVDPKPEWRYRDAEFLERDLDAWLQGRPVSARRAGVIERVRRWTARHPLRIALASLVLVAGLLGALSIGELAQGWGAANSARTAAEGGDLRELHRALLQVPALISPLALREDDLAPLRDQALSLDRSADWVAVHDLLVADEVESSLLQAARLVQRDGPDRQVLLTRYLLRAARGEESGSGSVRRSRVRPLAFLMLARICAEVPATTPAMATAYDPIRRQALAILQDAREAADLTERELGLLLSTLSGCGRLLDVRLIVATLTDPDHSLETQRMAARCLERVLRRALAGTESLQSPADAEREPFLEYFARIDAFGRSSGQEAYRRNAALDALLVWNLFEREAEGAVRPAPFLDELVRGHLSGILGRNNFRLLLLASLGDERCIPGLVAPESWLPPECSFGDWGRACGYLGRPEVTQIGSQASRASGSANDAAEFEQGLAETTRLWKGLRPDSDPDADTWLSAPRDQGSGFDVRRDSMSAGSEPTSMSNVLAVWDFMPDAASLRGWATAANGRNCRKEAGPRGFARMNPATESELTLEFVVPETGVRQDVELTLLHHRASREYFPDQGVVAVHVDLDGRPISAEFRFAGPVDRCDGLDFSWEWLGPGPHTIRIRLLSESTTTYWFYGACLSIPERWRGLQVDDPVLPPWK